MKKLLVLIVLTVFIATLYADLMVPTGKTPLNIESFKRAIRTQSNVSREAPEYEFVTDPVNLITNFYDYMPGNYNATPVCVQPDAVGGGIYITFHARETAASTRREYYAYINPDGTLFGCNTIGTVDIYEGYGGVDIDPVTGDPFCAWHVNIDGTGDLEVVCTYDTYHVLGYPGLWITPFVVMDDTTPQPYGPSDYFIWPYVHIGPSPDPTKRRVYVVANNGDSTPTGSPSENILLAYADFDEDDLNAQSSLSWSYNTIPLLNEWHVGIPECIRPSQSFDVSKTDGKVAFFGYNSNDEIHVFLNDNYGEGDFEFISLDYRFNVWNPQNLDDSYVFEEGGVPYTLYWSFVHCGHMNSIFTDGTNKLNFSGALGLQCYEGFNWPFWNYPKAFQYDLNTQEFSFHDLYITGANSDDNIPMVPWDLDEDGVVDSYDPSGYVEHVHGWPIYFWDTNTAFHENNMKMASNEDNGWLVNIWQDGLKSKYYNDWGDPDYIDWAEIAEVMISISSDGGATWSEPIIMNSLVGDENYVTQFDGMHPCYFYAGDKIEDSGNGWGLVHLFFLDDYSYGSTVHGWGENIGGMMEYASIKINFGLPSVIADFSANPTSGMMPLEVQFTDLSIGSIISWEWDFDNDSVIDSYDQNPLHTYAVPDTYSVSLTVYDAVNQDTETKIGYISVFGPIADFEADSTSGYCPLEVQFTDLSTGSIISWQWDFQNDGIYDSFIQNPSFTYTNAGIYSVKLKVSDGTNIDSLIQHNYITVEYVPPAPPTEVEINISGNDAIITWTAVDTTIFGTMITPDGYIVLNNEDPYTDFVYLSFTPDTTYTHVYVGQYMDQMFYRVVAVIYLSREEIKYLLSLNNSRDKVKWSDVKRNFNVIRK